MGSHSVTCHPTQVNAPRLTPAMQAGTRFTYPGWIEGWVDLVDLIASRPGVESATMSPTRNRCTTKTTRRRRITTTTTTSSQQYSQRYDISSPSKNNIDLSSYVAVNRCMIGYLVVCRMPFVRVIFSGTISGGGNAKIIPSVSGVRCFIAVSSRCGLISGLSLSRLHCFSGGHPVKTTVK